MAGVVTPTVGDLLADRYSLAAHIDDDSSGRQVWRGMDVLLNRPVTVVLRTPGGAAAEEMLTAAVAASHVNHPNVVGVYDAVDQGDCAYIVREWVEGQSLRDAVTATRLSCDDAVSILQCVADAVAAVHATGVAHGNVHPGTILLSDDDRVVLTDPRADARATVPGDVRAIGASLYCALTGTWPRTVDGPASLPDAPQDQDGHPVAPDLLREDVPPRLNTLVMDLIAPNAQVPPAAELAAELSEVLAEEDGTGALALVTPPSDSPAPKPLSPRVAGRRLALGAAALVGLAVVGLLAALILIPPSSTPTSDDESSGPTGNDANGGDNPMEPVMLDLSGDRVTVFDPDSGDNSAKEALGNLVDGDTGTAWKTSVYYSANWGNLKEGMGLIIDLGEEQQLVTVHVKLADPGADIGLYSATADGGVPNEADAIADPLSDAPTDVTFTISTDVDKVRYLLVWCPDPPQLSDGNFQWKVNEVEVFIR
ncbi:protein kinase family protein [Stackebrandtia soli]|uniref:protein kinase family protein n=1 Tax=Stackebrandtia soli TaxID=1892856 RepID=UPI0039E9769F